MQVRYASNSGAAYDLNRFGAHRQRGRKPNLTIAAPSAKARARAGMAAAFKTAAALALVAAFVVTMLYSRAVLTELNQQIAAQTNALADAQSENTRLSAQLDAKVSLRNVEEYATQALGMVSIDKSQITYVDLSEGDKIELTMDSPRLSLIARIRVAISNAKNPED